VNEYNIIIIILQTRPYAAALLWGICDDCRRLAAELERRVYMTFTFFFLLDVRIADQIIIDPLGMYGTKAVV